MPSERRFFSLSSAGDCEPHFINPTQCLCLWIPRSPGFGLSLVAETTNGTFLSAELTSNPQGQGAAVLPEDLGRNCAKLLLEEIYRVGPQPPRVGRGAIRAVPCLPFLLLSNFLPLPRA